MSNEHFTGCNHDGDYVYIGRSSAECERQLRGNVTPLRPGYMATFLGSSRMPVEVRKAWLDPAAGFSLVKVAVDSIDLL